MSGYNVKKDGVKDFFNGCLSITSGGKKHFINLLLVTNIQLHGGKQKATDYDLKWNNAECEPKQRADGSEYFLIEKWSITFSFGPAHQVFIPLSQGLYTDLKNTLKASKNFFVSWAKKEEVVEVPEASEEAEPVAED